MHRRQAPQDATCGWACGILRDRQPCIVSGHNPQLNSTQFKGWLTLVLHQQRERPKIGMGANASRVPSSFCGCRGIAMRPAHRDR